MMVKLTEHKEKTGEVRKMAGREGPPVAPPRMTQ